MQLHQEIQRRSLNPLKWSLNHPKKVTLIHQVYGFRFKHRHCRWWRPAWFPAAVEAWCWLLWYCVQGQTQEARAGSWLASPDKWLGANVWSFWSCAWVGSTLDFFHPDPWQLNSVVSRGFLDDMSLKNRCISNSQHAPCLPSLGISLRSRRNGRVFLFSVAWLSETSRGKRAPSVTQTCINGIQWDVEV